MASCRAYWTPLNVPCGAATNVLASMRPAAQAGDATAVAIMTTAAWMRIFRKDKHMEDLLFFGIETHAHHQASRRALIGCSQLTLTQYMRAARRICLRFSTISRS